MAEASRNHTPIPALKAEVFADVDAMDDALDAAITTVKAAATTVSGANKNRILRLLVEERING